MVRRNRDEKLGQFHKLDVSKSSAPTILMPEAAFLGLVGYLNRTDAESTRVASIVEAMRELEKIPNPIWGQTKQEREFPHPMIIERQGAFVPHPLLKKVSPQKYEQEMDVARRKSLINRELAKHRFLPYVAPLQHGQWLVMWRIQKERRPAPDATLMVADDATALQMVLDIARAGQLNRLRRCQRCLKWLYAHYRHQNFCSTTCQQTLYRTSAEWRAKRRDYMRRYRQKNY